MVKKVAHAPKEIHVHKCHEFHHAGNRKLPCDEREVPRPAGVLLTHTWLVLACASDMALMMLTMLLCGHYGALIHQVLIARSKNLAKADFMSPPLELSIFPAFKSPFSPAPSSSYHKWPVLSGGSGCHRSLDHLPQPIKGGAAYQCKRTRP